VNAIIEVLLNKINKMESKGFKFTDIPDDLYLENMWKFLSVNEMLNLCQTSRFFSQICSDHVTWIYLIKRDFNVDYNGDDAELQYYLYYDYLNLIDEYENMVKYNKQHNINKARKTAWNIIKNLGIKKNIIKILLKKNLRSSIYVALKSRYEQLNGIFLVYSFEKIAKYLTLIATEYSF